MGYSWKTSTGDIPSKAVQAGVDKDGLAIYVGRAVHEGDRLPAKVLEKQPKAYVTHNGKEHEKDAFEVLCEKEKDVSWKAKKDGKIKKGAVTSGNTSSGEPLYVGRVFHDGIQTPGKIHPSHGCFYIPYNGQELTFTAYQVLIIS